MFAVTNFQFFKLKNMRAVIQRSSVGLLLTAGHCRSWGLKSNNLVFRQIIFTATAFVQALQPQFWPRWLLPFFSIYKFCPKVSKLLSGSSSENSLCCQGLVCK